ncbi:MAG: hypothetical protein SPD95_11670 [Candidatus Faecousia sp.]|nr:hypothetical protein [Candidatus Faecousia sp.]
MANKNVTLSDNPVTEETVTSDDGPVDLFVDRDPSDDNPNVVIGFNGKNYVMPRGEVSRVPKYIKDEYERSKRAQYKADKTVAEMKGIKAAN